jgi:hypothetical protein
MRAVRSFHLDKAAASVLTTCVSTCSVIAFLTQDDVFLLILDVLVWQKLLISGIPLRKLPPAEVPGKEGGDR